MAQLSTTSLFSDSNLKEYYKLENANADKNSNTLTNTGTVTFGTAKYSNGADFSTTWGNSGKRLKVSTGFSVNLANEWSICCWIKEKATIIGTSAVAHIIDWSNTTTNDRRITLKYQDNSGTPRLIMSASGNDTTYNTTIGTSTFQHIAVTKASGGTVTIYLNGVSVATGTMGTSTGTGAGEFSIGNALDSTTANGAAALIDDVAAFDRALTLAEIRSLAFDLSVSETVSLTETISVIRGVVISKSETVSLTETISTTAPRRLWPNTSKNSVTWSNQSKP